MVGTTNSGTSGVGTRIPISSVPGASATATAATACYSATPWEKGYNTLGGTVWQYNQGIAWCGYPGTLTSRQNANDYGNNTGLGWSWDSSYSNFTNSGGAGYSTWTHWNQGHFCLASYFSCVQNAYPSISTTVYGNGTYTASFG